MQAFRVLLGDEACTVQRLEQMRGLFNTWVRGKKKNGKNMVGDEACTAQRLPVEQMRGLFNTRGLGEKKVKKTCRASRACAFA